MFTSQTRDLYHIETDRKGGYIEFAVRQIYRAEQSEAYRQIASVGTDAVLVICAVPLRTLRIDINP